MGRVVRPPGLRRTPWPGPEEDAALVVELAKLGAMNGLREAVGKIFADDFDPDTAEPERPVGSHRPRLERDGGGRS